MAERERGEEGRGGRGAKAAGFGGRAATCAGADGKGKRVEQQRHTSCSCSSEQHQHLSKILSQTAHHGQATVDGLGARAVKHLRMHMQANNMCHTTECCSCRRVFKTFAEQRMHPSGRHTPPMQGQPKCWWQSDTPASARSRQHYRGLRASLRSLG